MNTQPYELKVAELLDDEVGRIVKLELMYRHAAQIIQRLYKENAELRVKLEEKNNENNN